MKRGAVCCCRRCRSHLNSTWDLADLALAQASEAYGGTLLDGAPYAWVEVPREDTRRRAVDALAPLAKLRQTAGDLEGALQALDQAIAADPVAEELYRRLMRLEAEVG